MDYFGTQAEIDALTARLDALEGVEHRDALTQLAWFLRQRDTDRAWRLMERAQALADDADDPRSHACRGRLLLVRADAMSLQGDVAGAAPLWDRALEAFRAAGDLLGEGDVRLEEIRRWTDIGSAENQERVLVQAVDIYARGGDPFRHAYAESLLAQHVLYTHEDVKAEDWMPTLTSAAALNHPGVDAMVHFVFGDLHDAKGEAGQAMAHYRLSHEAALRSGRIRAAINAAVNVANIYFELGRLDEAVQWGEDTLSLARHSGWRLPMATVLADVAHFMRHIGRAEQAAPLLAEATQLIASAPSSRVAGQVHYQLGMIENDPARALEALDRAHAVARDLKYKHLDARVQRGQAEMLSRAGRVEEAMACIGTLLQTQQSPFERVEALRQRAAIEAHHGLAPPAGSDAASAAVATLHEALELARAGGVATHEVLADLSRAHEAAGRLAEALKIEREAAAARERSRAEVAEQLAISLQVRHETERARLEAARHQALAHAEAARAEAHVQASRAKSVHLASMSHELRSPLNAILGLTQLLLHEPSLQPHREELEVILRNGGDLHALIDQVLREAKAELKPQDEAGVRSSGNQGQHVERHPGESRDPRGPIAD